MRISGLATHACSWLFKDKRGAETLNPEPLDSLQTAARFRVLGVSGLQGLRDLRKGIQKGVYTSLLIPLKVLTGRIWRVYGLKGILQIGGYPLYKYEAPYCHRSPKRKPELGNLPHLCFFVCRMCWLKTDFGVAFRGTGQTSQIAPKSGTERADRPCRSSCWRSWARVAPPLPCPALPCVAVWSGSCRAQLSQSRSVQGSL